MDVLVCDDQQGGFEAASQLIPEGHNVQGRYENELKEALSALFDSISRVLRGDCTTDPAQLQPFAGFDVAIVDNNLSELDFKGARLSAETIIGYLRAFSDIPYIVSLNKNPDVDFDLRYLFGDYQSQGDLAINTRHLECGRLWSATTDDGFAPWYWPQLPEVATRRREQVEFVLKCLDAPIWRELHFPDAIADHLSRRAQAALDDPKTQHSTSQTTFREFFNGTRTLLADDCRVIGEIADGGNELAKGILSRVVAADIDRWIRRDLLGPQDMLIDLPHLVARMPYLLGGNARDLERWNDVLVEEGEPFGMDVAIYREHVGPTRFDPRVWAPRPCFWWPTLNADDGLFDLLLASGEWPHAAFCEDLSKFVFEEDGFQEIEVEMESSWPRRHVKQVEGRQYSPRSRFI